MFTVILLREMRIFFRNTSCWLNPILFVLLAITLFTLGIGPDPIQLAQNAPGVIWVVALLGVMLSLDSLFRSDYDDGSLELLLLSPSPLYFAIMAKVVAHWAITGLPLVLISPLFVTLLGLPVSVLPTLALSLGLGSGVLSFLGAIAASVTVSLKSGGLLIALLILPLYVPVIIFGAGMLHNAVAGLPTSPSIYMLSGLLVGAATLAPIAVAGGLRLSVD